MASVRAYLTLAAVCLAVVVVVRAGVPEDLSNFHNEYVCDTEVRLVR